jgi:hypothetical protein
MRARQLAAVVVISAATVVATDLMMHSSLLRMLRPQVVAPADGAIVSGAVTVRWEGPQPMQAVLTGGGQRVDLGLRESPFDIDESRFPRPGQYGVELRSPRFGSWIGADRRFMVRRARERGATADTGGDGPGPGGGAGGAARGGAQPALDDQALIAALGERDRLRAEVADLENQLATLREDTDDLDAALEELQADTEARLAAGDSQREELAREHLLALQENQLLRMRMESIPPCTAWGYVALPRPQTSPPSRLVVVSDRAGNVFRTEAACVRVRRADPTGASPCACVGPVWGGG